MLTASKNHMKESSSPVPFKGLNDVSLLLGKRLWASSESAQRSGTLWTHRITAQFPVGIQNLGFFQRPNLNVGSQTVFFAQPLKSRLMAI